MIVFDLKCRSGHVFEAWFASSEAYERQRVDKLLVCPVCQDGEIGKAVMAPAVSAKGNQRSEATPVPPPQAEKAPIAAGLPPAVREKLAEAVALVAQAQQEVISRSQWVGDKFADEARAMHYGEREQAPIHGTASADEARSMMEEGLAVAPLLVPVVPPDQIN